MYSFVGSFYISFDGPVVKYLHVMQRGLSSNPRCYVYNFFIITSLGASVQIWFHHSFWDYVVPDRITRMTLELMKFGNEFWPILFREYISPNLFAVTEDAESGGFFDSKNLGRMS